MSLLTGGEWFEVSYKPGKGELIQRGSEIWATLQLACNCEDVKKREHGVIKSSGPNSTRPLQSTAHCRALVGHTPTVKHKTLGITHAEISSLPV